MILLSTVKYSVYRLRPKPVQCTVPYSFLLYRTVYIIIYTYDTTYIRMIPCIYFFNAFILYFYAFVRTHTHTHDTRGRTGGLFDSYSVSTRIIYIIRGLLIHSTPHQNFAPVPIPRRVPAGTRGACLHTVATPLTRPSPCKSAPYCSSM